MNRRAISVYEKVDSMVFPFHQDGMDFMTELGLTPHIAKALIDSRLKDMEEELHKANMSLKVCAKISESVAFESIAKAFMQHWMTCEGELDKAIDVACESLSFPIKKKALENVV